MEQSRASIEVAPLMGIALTFALLWSSTEQWGEWSLSLDRLRSAIQGEQVHDQTMKKFPQVGSQKAARALVVRARFARRSRMESSCRAR